MSPVEIFFLIIAAIIVAVIGIVLGIAIPISHNNKKYQAFVEEHSVALKQLEALNAKYRFVDVANFGMKKAYDNEKVFADLTPKDYLTYQLVSIGDKVDKAMDNALYNKKQFALYCKEIADNCPLGQYDTEDVLKDKEKLLYYEKQLFGRIQKQPVVGFSIIVKLILTNINGDYKASKKYNFNAIEIEDLIDAVHQKRGHFYTNEEVWKSICRVERAKVTNRMRFAIYQRDGNRCCKCHRRTNDLEIDHIIPISKGGKSVPENLQTLCHDCNVRKGSDIEYN